MTNLHSDLRDILNRHQPSKSKEAQDILMELQLLLTREAPAYEYRHHLGWDNTWMELDKSQLEAVLKMGHRVERRRIVGGWEPYTGGRPVPQQEPEVGMFPVDPMAPRPEVPHAERIFAASRDLFEAWERGAHWAVEVPVHEAYVIFFLETISDAISDLCDRWNAAGRIGTFPDSIAVQEELKRIICLEDNRARDAMEPEGGNS